MKAIEPIYITVSEEVDVPLYEAAYDGGTDGFKPITSGNSKIVGWTKETREVQVAVYEHEGKKYLLSSTYEVPKGKWDFKQEWKMEKRGIIPAGIDALFCAMVLCKEENGQFVPVFNLPEGANQDSFLFFANVKNEPDPWKPKYSVYAIYNYTFTMTRMGIDLKAVKYF